MKQEKRKINAERYHRLNDYFKWLLLGVITLTVTVSIYPSLIVKQHAYLLGDVVDADVKAPKDFLFEEKEATESNVQAAVEAVRTVYDHDTTLAKELTRKVNNAFETMQETIQEGMSLSSECCRPGDFPRAVGTSNRRGSGPDRGRKSGTGSKSIVGQETRIREKTGYHFE